MKELGPILNHKIIRPSIIQCRHHWEEDVAIFPGDWKMIFGTNLSTLNIGQMKYGRPRWQKGGGNKNIFSYCTDPSGQENLYLRALQGHSGRNPIDPTLQDNVLIPDNFFEYIYPIGCAVSLHYITNSGLIPGGQNSSRERQTVFFTSVNPMNEEHRDPQELDLTKPRLPSYKQKWKDIVIRKDNSQSWVRISDGSNKFVIDSNNNDTEVPADLPEGQASQPIVKVFAARSKAKAKPQKRELVDVPSMIPMHERKMDWYWAIRTLSLSAYEVSKKVISLLLHNQTVQREEDGAIQFWRIKFHLRNQFSQISCWSDDRWKVCLAAGGGAKRRYQYCSDVSGTILYLRALQGHSGRNPLHYRAMY